MKKLMIPVLALASFLFVACSKPSPTDEAISLLNEATEQIEKVESIDDLQKMSADFEVKFAELDKKYPDYKPTDEENTKLLEAQQKFEEACQKKAETLVSDMLGDLGDGDDPGEPEEEAEE